jgi:hypothetical protein
MTRITCTVSDGARLHERSMTARGDFLALPQGEVTVSTEDAMRVLSEACDWGQGELTEREFRELVRIERDPKVDPDIRAEGPVLSWHGTFTPGRRVEVELRGSKSSLRWDTGTGKPSWFLGRALAHAGLARIDASELGKASGCSPEVQGRLAAAVVR